MVKVIKIKKKAPQRIDCACGAVLEYTEDEVDTYHGTDRSGGPDGYKWIKCPNCHKQVVLESW